MITDPLDEGFSLPGIYLEEGPCGNLKLPAEDLQRECIVTCQQHFAKLAGVNDVDRQVCFQLGHVPAVTVQDKQVFLIDSLPEHGSFNAAARFKL